MKDVMIVMIAPWILVWYLLILPPNDLSTIRKVVFGLQLIVLMTLRAPWTLAAMVPARTHQATHYVMIATLAQLTHATLTKEDALTTGTTPSAMIIMFVPLTLVEYQDVRLPTSFAMMISTVLQKLATQLLAVNLLQITHYVMMVKAALQTLVTSTLEDAPMFLQILLVMMVMLVQ
jgi:hypothetical protein